MRMSAGREGKHAGWEAARTGWVRAGVVAALGFLAISVLSQGVQAAESGSLELFVVPNSMRSISVLINSTNTYSFGSILVGGGAVSSLPITVENTGNIATTVAVQVSSQAVDQGLTPGGQPLNQHWTVVDSTPIQSGVDQFVLYAVFQSTLPLNGQYADANHWVRSFPVLSSSVTFAGGQSGVLIPAIDAPPSTEKVALWLNLYPPTRSSNLKPKKFWVTITAAD